MANSLKEAIEELQTKYAGTSYPQRLEEAASIGTVGAASAFFVRDNDEVTNVVWLADGIIYDVTWFKAASQSTLNVIALPDVISFEVRESPNVVRNTFDDVGGDFLIKAIARSTDGSLYWGASFGDEAEALRGFLMEVLKAFASSRQDASG